MRIIIIISICLYSSDIHIAKDHELSVHSVLRVFGFTIPFLNGIVNGDVDQLTVPTADPRSRSVTRPNMRRVNTVHN